MQTPAARDEAVYTMAEAARLKGASYHTISRAIRKGILPCTRMGRQALIRESDLDAWSPMTARRPKKYAGRTPDAGVRPSVILPGTGGAPASGSIDRLTSLLALLGGNAPSGAVLEEILGAIADTLHCADAAIITRDAAGRRFEVRAAVGSKRDWLDVAGDGPRVMTRPVTLAGHTLGLFVGIPDVDRPVLSSQDRDAALAMLTLAAIALS